MKTKKRKNFQGKTTSKIVFRHPNLSILITICLFLLGCQGLQVNIPVEVQSVKREETALLVLVENKSTRQIKITYPVSTGMLKQGQYTVFRLPKPDNYKVVVTAYTEDPDYRDVYKPVATVEIPVFLNGYDTVRARGNFVGYYLEVTDGMLLPNK
ncbi:MAG: hypothetical protein M0Z64_09245 [Nitrospiraceae bacterium]|nr:hypothetical protein [Nitrospiraceae bacterium]